MGQSWSRWQQRRSAKTLQELAPQKTPGHEYPLPQLNRDVLLAALGNVASYINKKGGSVTVVAVGGAVNTIHLRSRNVTHDVDFYNNNLTSQDFAHLVNGAKEAAKRNKLLEEEWFNNRTILFMPRDQRAALTQEAFAQGEVIFQQPGLTVLAAPWNYAFCCKIDRLAGGGITGPRSYDFDDALQYLSRYLQRHGVRQLQKATVQAWFVRYSLRWTPQVEEAMARINQSYRQWRGVNYDIIVSQSLVGVRQ
ncbi:hypothetical protein F5Y13DRAFT_92260 [Hypoxylon sp. FL1857]|nr:hypothetical protein F5Y13DRAFT_92260 [Hypoxylon sp. FL1857]